VDILLSSTEDEDPWFRELSRAMPSARIHRGSAPVPCRYAMLWQPSPDLLSGGDAVALRGIFSLGAGVDSLMPTLPPEALPPSPSGSSSVPIIRVEDAGMGDQMAEYALYAVLESFRQFRFYETEQREERWNPQPTRAREEYPVGVLGLGVLGGTVARTVAGFGFPVLGWGRSSRKIPGVRCVSGTAGLDELLATARVLVILLPLTAETRGLMDRRALAQLPRDSVVVNLARGPLIVETDLREALDSGQIAHAYLDVFDEEPLPPGHPWWNHPRVTVTPHVAAQTLIGPAARQIAEKVERLEAGLPVSGVVNMATGY
jgi:glyoxylate/hydroxypyruvate reductase A